MTIDEALQFPQQSVAGCMKPAKALSNCIDSFIGRRIHGANQRSIQQINDDELSEREHWMISIVWIDWIARDSNEHKILLSKLLNVQLVTLISLFKASAICIHWGQSVINESSKRKYSFICMFWKISEDSVKWASTWTISSSMFTKDYQSFLYQVDQFGWKVTLQMAMAANSAHYRLLIAYSAHCHTPTLPKKKY